MTAYRRHALFQLGVLALTAVAVLTLFLLFGDPLASLAGFALLGLLGLRPLLLGRDAARPVQDERDEAIQQRATAAGHGALWLALVAWGVFVPLRFHEAGAVPLVWVAPVVWVAWWLVTCVQSLTILVLDRRGL